MLFIDSQQVSRRAMLLRGAALAVFVSFSGMTAAGPADPAVAMGLVRTTTEALLNAVKALPPAVESSGKAGAFALVEKHISPHVDLERSSRWVLGKYWRKATPSQRTRFIAEFRILLLRTYALAVAENPNAEIEYLPVRKTRRENETIVRTRVPQRGAPPIKVHYRMHRGKDGWKLFDVSIEGVSLVSTYRTSFTQRVKSRGIDGLIEDMAAKNRPQQDA
jgi:phospholipid transport system substrate-binding protein